MKIKSICRKKIVYKNCKSPLAIRFIHERTIKVVSLGLSVEPCYWDFDAQMLTSDCPERRTLQSKIDSKIEAYNNKIRRLEALDVEVNFDTLFETKAPRVTITVADGFKREIERLESLGKYHTASKVRTAYSLVSKFRSPNIRLEEIDMVYINDFEVFLRKKGNKDNSIATKFSVLKAIYNKALTEELFTPKTNPLVRFKVGRLWTATRKRAITKEELQRFKITLVV